MNHVVALRNLRRVTLGALAVGCLVALSSAALAVPITYNFTGTVQAGTVGWGTAVVNDALTGTFTFDDGLTDQIASDGAARYGVGALTSGVSGSLTAGGFTTYADSLFDTNGSFLQLYDDSPNDTFTFSVEGLNLALLKLGAGPALSGVLDGVVVDPIATALLALDNIDPADFTNSGPSTWIISAGTKQIRFSLNSITAVAEPATAFLLGLGLFGMGYARRR